MKLSLRARLAIAAGRLSSRLLRLIGRSATALPGKLALTIDSSLLNRLVHDRRVFLVTGTNGKTTTVRMLCRIFESHGFSIITNPSGANLDSGLTTKLLEHLPILRAAAASDENNQKTALVFEIDEAFFGKLAERLDPEICIVTNFFRDQLDRFGELQHTRDLIAKGLTESQTKAVLCADDSLCASLGRERSDPTVYFGVATGNLEEPDPDTVIESPFCLFCGTRYMYDALVYGHLGLFHCPKCGFRRPDPDLTFSQISATERLQILAFNMNQETVQAKMTVPGLHNAYNASAALLAAVTAGLPIQSSARALELTEAAFGRMERFSIGSKEICLILVKNPVGLERALDFVHQATDVGAFMTMLNAQDPDGRDVSWIWDVHMEDHLPDGIIGVSGERCADLALRLYYAGKERSDLLIDMDHLRLFDQLIERCTDDHCLYILPNYTAMLSLRADLAKRYQLRDIWR